jgi:hypothetical protein
VFFQVSFAWLDICRCSGKHRICLPGFPSRGGVEGPWGEVGRRRAAIEGRRDGRGEVPEEDQSHPPRAAPGSRNLPWDACKIPTKPAEPQVSSGPQAGGWDGGSAFARGVGGGIVPGSGTSSTAKILSVCTWYVVGTPRGGNAPGGRCPRGVRNMRRRSVSDGGKVLARASPLSRGIRRRRKRRSLPARGHAAKPLFRAYCAIGRVATRLRAIRVERRLPIAAMRAAGRCVGCGTESASTWPARRKQAD